MSKLLEVRDVDVVFTSGLGGRVRKRALDEMSIAVGGARPSITAVVGESGSGKSTLIRLLLGFQPPSRGEVFYDGKSLATLTAAERRLFRREVQAIFQDPFDVFNPFVIWLLVVFISGISFIGYILIKTLGTQKGMGLTGILGGIASSTAVTLSLTQRSRHEDALSRPFALAIFIAWTIMFARLFVIVLVLNVKLAAMLWRPMLVPIAVGLAYALFLFILHRSEEKAEMRVTNPFELWPAITFGVIFTLILFIAKAAQIYLGESGIYLTSFLSGLAVVDAITLSLTQLSDGKNGIQPATAARAIVFATAANTFLKGVLVLGIGSAPLRKIVLPGFLLLVCGAFLAVFLT